MAALSTVSRAISRADARFESHRPAWFVLLIAAPALVRLLFAVCVSDGSAVEGLTDGLLFGVAFATTSVLIDRSV